MEPGEGVRMPPECRGDLSGVRVELSVSEAADAWPAAARDDAELSGSSIGAAARLARGVLAVVVLLGIKVRLGLGLRFVVLSAAVPAWAPWGLPVPGRRSRVVASWAGLGGRGGGLEAAPPFFSYAPLLWQNVFFCVPPWV